MLCHHGSQQYLSWLLKHAFTADGLVGPPIFVKHPQNGRDSSPRISSVCCQAVATGNGERGNHPSPCPAPAACSSLSWHGERSGHSAANSRISAAKSSISEANTNRPPGSSAAATAARVSGLMSRLALCRCCSQGSGKRQDTVRSGPPYPAGLLALVETARGASRERRAGGNEMHLGARHRGTPGGARWRTG